MLDFPEGLFWSIAQNSAPVLLGCWGLCLPRVKNLSVEIQGENRKTFPALNSNLLCNSYFNFDTEKHFLCEESSQCQ